MRIDKYLWCVRYFKTRNIASKACKKGAVRVNESVVKPSRDVFSGDTISIRKNQVNYLLEVIAIPKSRVGAKLVSLYCLDKTPKENFENKELLKFVTKQYRKKGTGRPTKRDRRNLEDFTLSISEEE